MAVGELLARIGGGLFQQAYVVDDLAAAEAAMRDALDAVLEDRAFRAKADPEIVVPAASTIVVACAMSPTRRSASRSGSAATRSLANQAKKAAPLQARNSATCATSSAVPRRCSGVTAMRLSISAARSVPASGSL